MKIAREQLIKKYLDFFKSKNHKEIQNASLIPHNDPTVLFTTAGMHPLVPYLLGQKHPLGKRLVNVQKCIRTQDIDEVGDDFHLTFFEMLGNWSLGDYFKREAIEYSFEFLTKVLGIKKDKISITCFAGDKTAEKDIESADIWKDVGIKRENIKFLPKSDNWWGPAGETGPCGPDTEMFVNNCEIWNDVFMQYNKNKEGNYEELNQKNVDTGMGVERTLAILNNKTSIYETEVFLPIIKEIERLSGRKYGKDKDETRAMRIIADHIKASVMILNENILPSNTEQGYVLRRLIRRAIRYAREFGIKESFISNFVSIIADIYPDYKLNIKNIKEELEKEEDKFKKTVEDGLKIADKIFCKKTPIKKEKFAKLMFLKEKEELLHKAFEKIRRGERAEIKEAGISANEFKEAIISGKEAFLLYQSYGFPIEMVIELAREKNLLVPVGDFKQELKKHQELSRTSSEGRFKSGLADNSEQTTKYHTATHLLLAALKQVLGQHIEQKGSNITSERLRFDFNYKEKLSPKQIKEIEKIVNENIKKKLEVKREEMSVKEAKAKGATGIFDEKYGNLVSVYTVCNPKDTFSKEICAGPHVSNTSELGKFKIIKEESSASGVRRIKAILE